MAEPSTPDRKLEGSNSGPAGTGREKEKSIFEKEKKTQKQLSYSVILTNILSLKYILYGLASFD